MSFPRKKGFSRNIRLLRSLFYIQGFYKFNNFTRTSISKGKASIQTIALYICNTRVISKTFEWFFEWITGVSKGII